MKKRFFCILGAISITCAALCATAYAGWTGDSGEGSYSDSWFDSGDSDDFWEEFMKEFEELFGDWDSWDSGSSSWGGQSRLEYRTYFDGATTRDCIIVSNGDTSGECGAQTRWEFHPGDNTLRISGTGAMDDGKVPWGSILSQVESIVVDAGVTRIGDCAFISCENAASISIPETVTSIGACAFEKCGSLRDVYYAGHRRQWDKIQIGVSCAPLTSAAIHCADSASPAAGTPGFENFQHTKPYRDVFSDVGTDAWYYKNVAAVYEMELMNGVGPDRFAPGDNVSVAQLLALVCRLRSIYLNDGYEFRETSPWYLTYADYVMDRDLVERLEQLDYNAPATRTDLVKILGALPGEMLAPINQISDQAIPNVTDDNPYKENVYALYRAGIIGGNDARGTFEPEAVIRRSEVASIAARAAEPALRSRFSLSAEYVTLYSDSGKSIQSPSWEADRYLSLGWQRAPFTVSPSSSSAEILNSAALTPMLTNYAPLDDLVGQIFEQIFTGGMTTHDKLKACYDYLIEHTEYGHPDTTGIADRTAQFGPYDSRLDAYYISSAYALLKTGVGVCTNYAAAFMVMARRIGAEAYVINGETSMAGGGYTGHSWNIITVGGTDYVFDAQVEDNIAKGGEVHYYRFCKTADQVARNYKNYDIADDKAGFGEFKCH